MAETDAQTPPQDDMARLREKAERFGPGYAAMSEVLSGKGVDRAVTGMKLVIAAFAAFVVLGAIWSKF